jgi:hypothetical protein
VSFFRPRFPDRPLRAEDFEATFRLRGLKGFQPHHIVGFQDPLFTEEPQFWVTGGSLPAAVGFTGHLGVQTPDIRDLITIVDKITVSSSVVEDWTVEVGTGEGAVLAVLATDSQVHLRNRRDQGAVLGFPARVGLSRIADNTNALTGQSLQMFFSSPAEQAVNIDLGYRLFKNEQLFVRNINANKSINAVILGRLMKRT